MTNKEYYKDEIFNIACKCDSIAFDERTNEMVGCDNLDCENCKFRWSIENIGGCIKAIPKWLEEEYVEGVDWSKVEVDTKILVRDSQDGKWIKRHFAKYENGKVYAFNGGYSSWTNMDNVIDWKYAKLYEDLQEIKNVKVKSCDYDKVIKILEENGVEIK